MKTNQFNKYEVQNLQKAVAKCKRYNWMILAVVTGKHVAFFQPYNNGKMLTLLMTCKLIKPFAGCNTEQMVQHTAWRAVGTTEGQNLHITYLQAIA